MFCTQTLTVIIIDCRTRLVHEQSSGVISANH